MGEFRFTHRLIGFGCRPHSVLNPRRVRHQTYEIKHIGGGA
jgi:hypothetical protein